MITEEISIHDLNRRLKIKADELRLPFDVTLEITYGCNLRCIHCYNPTHQALATELAASDFANIMDQLADLGSVMINFSGGEPLTRPDAFDLFFYAKEKGLQVVLLTNATLIDSKKIERLKKLSPTLISVSVYGMTQATYESVTRIPGSYDKFLSGVAFLRASGIPLIFKMPVMTLNAHELPEAIRWFAHEKLPFTHSLEIHPRVDGNPEPLGVRLSEDQLVELRMTYGKEDGCALRRGPAAQKTSPFNCNCGRNAAAVSPYGEMNLCVTTQYPQYSLRTGSVREGWNLMVRFVADRSPSELFECPSCDLAAYCSQGAMDAWMATKNFDPCLPYFKNAAKKMRAKLN